MNNLTYIIILFGSSLLAVSSGIISTVVVLKKEGLLIDTISHALLPGVLLAFLLSGTTNAWVLLFGGFISGFVALIATNYLKRQPNLNFNSILAIILSGFFSLGIVLLSVAQKQPSATQAGLKNFIFGQLGAISYEDTIVFVVISILVSILFIIFYKLIKVALFDQIQLQISTSHANLINFIINSLIILIVVIQIKLTGIILTTTIMVLPGACALKLSTRFAQATIISIAIALSATVIGNLIAFSGEGIPVGAMICLVLTLICFLVVGFDIMRRK